MRPSLVLVLVIAVLVGTGVYLLLERSLTRVLVGAVLLSNGVNLLLLVAGGAAGRPPLTGDEGPGPSSDPLPQALTLTAIVITLGLTAFLLAMAYRSWQLHRHDEVQDDVEDRRIARLAARDERAFTDADTEADTGRGRSSLDEEAAELHDDTDEGTRGGAR
ncbi:Na(+)/H(+) antiporter subunit C [Cellulomonas marina]|nr:Na(+)/H(+) antiporter subunit C [Cellulomonas marina]